MNLMTEKNYGKGHDSKYEALLALGAGFGGGFFGGHSEDENTTDLTETPLERRRQVLADRLATWEQVRLGMNGEGDARTYRAICNVIEKVETELDSIPENAFEHYFNSESAKLTAQRGLAQEPVTFGQPRPTLGDMFDLDISKLLEYTPNNTLEDDYFGGRLSYNFDAEKRD
ncbi:hypothetical protein KY329_00340 [Candidatus Woesearchaeota archaeon]|nr:hypothetical protein [Candidatus Woesearchaeota archaeon]